MAASLLLLSLVLPSLLALWLGAWPAGRFIALRLAPFMPFIGLVFSLIAAPGDILRLPWLLLGVELGIDETGQVFLLFTALLWSLAGWYSSTYLGNSPARHRFWVFFLLAMTGNFGLVLAQDILSFYAFFALMTFASYGLVVHEGSPFALRAGTVYIILAVLGEFLLLVGFILAARAVGGLDLTAVPAAVALVPNRDLIVGLLLAGFGVKAGMLLLHVWLPLAHPAAPTPASAVLSGAMIKAGLLGWLRFLPLGETAMPGWGVLLLVLGIAGAFYGVAIGMTQTNPKSSLAYSSVSQMGMMILAVGIGLAVPEAWPLTLTAVIIYALHHGLAKGALFLSIGVVGSTIIRRWQRRVVLALLALPALAIAGAPLTSGAVAKVTLKHPAALAPLPWPQFLDWLLPLAAVGTTLLMARFLFLAREILGSRQGHTAQPGLLLPWTLLVIAATFAAWIVPWFYVIYTVGEPVLPPGPLWEAGWPVMLGGIAAWGGWWLHRTRGWTLPEVAPGDLVTFVDKGIRFGVRATWDWYHHIVAKAGMGRAHWMGTANARMQGWLRRTETRLAGWETTGIILLALVIVFTWFLS